MGRVLISNLAPLKEDDLTFFRSLIDSLETFGFNIIFWSGPYHRGFSKYYVPLDWNIANWKTHLKFDEDDFKLGQKFIEDPNKWIARIQLLAKQDLSEFTVEELYKFLVSFGYKILSEVKPDVFLIWNTLCPHAGIAGEIARKIGIKCLLLERGNFPKTWFLEEGGLIGHSVLSSKRLKELVKPWEYHGFEIVGRNYLNSWNRNEIPKYRQNPLDDEASTILKLGISCKKMVFFPPDDLSLGFIPFDGRDREKHLPGFKNSYEAAKALATRFVGITIFKPHPSFENWDLISIPEIQFFVLNVDYRELVDWADIIATTGSGLQFYALSRGKPVINMANDIISNKEIVFEAKQESEIDKVLEEVEAFNAPEERLRNLNIFLGFLLTRYLISLENSTDCFRKPVHGAQFIIDRIGSAKEAPFRFKDYQKLRANIVSPELLKKFKGQYEEDHQPDYGKGIRSFSRNHLLLRDELESAGENDLILVDFDHTLFLNNSTEWFLEKSWPKSIVFFLTRFGDYICKKSGLKSEKWRDYIRVHLVAILTPWNLLTWSFMAKRTAMQFANPVLTDYLEKAKGRVFVVSNGFSFVINPLLKWIIPAAELVAGKFLQDRKSVCVQGKVKALQERMPNLDLVECIFITDSISDRQLLEVSKRSFLLEWGDEKFKAFKNFYFPFRYYAEAKYPGRNFVIRQLFGEDYLLLLLAYSLDWRLFGAISFLFLSLMSIYEIGYFWNDFKTEAKEKNPRISREARQFLNYPFSPRAYIFSGVSACIGLYIGGFWNVAAGLSWIGVLLSVLVSFRLFNSLSAIRRKYLFPILHSLKSFGYVSLFSLNPIGFPLLLSQLITQLTIYNIYRHKGDISLFGRQRYRLFIFPLLLMVFSFQGDHLYRWKEYAVYSGLALIWLGYRAITEKFGPLKNLMKWKK